MAEEVSCKVGVKSSGPYCSVAGEGTEKKLEDPVVEATK